MMFHDIPQSRKLDVSSNPIDALPVGLPEVRNVALSAPRLWLGGFEVSFQSNVFQSRESSRPTYIGQPKPPSLRLRVAV